MQEPSREGVDFADRLRRSHGRASRNRVISAKVTEDERRELEKTAHESGKAISEWARDTLMREARRSADDILLTELTGLRLLLVNMLCPMLTGKTVNEEWISKTMDAVRQQKHRVTKELVQLYAEGGK